MLWKIDNIWSVKIDEIDWDKFSSLWPLAGDKKPDNAWSLESGPVRLTDDEVYGLMEMGIDLKPVPYPGTMMVKMQDRKKWEHSTKVAPEDLNSGNIVNITIPDIGLLRISRVTVVEDYCTDQLQSWLDDGWRILAVCPPNAARRPDYILGHTDKEADRGR